MATQTKTWAYLSDSDGWSVNTTGNTLAQWQSTDGSPANGCLQANTDYGRNRSGTATWSVSLKGTDMNVPAGATITHAQVTLQRRVSYWTSPTYSRWRITLAGQTIRDLEAETGLAAWAARDSGEVQLSPTIGAGDTFTLAIYWEHANGNTANAGSQLRWDTVALTLTYSAPDALTAMGVTTGAPVLGASDIAQGHALTTEGLATAPAIMAAATLGQTHTLVATALVGTAAILGTPVLQETGAVHELLAASIALSPPVLGAATIGQHHDLSPLSITVGQPIVADCTIGQAHQLISIGIVTGVPEITFKASPAKPGKSAPGQRFPTPISPLGPLQWGG